MTCAEIVESFRQKDFKSHVSNFIKTWSGDEQEFDSQLGPIHHAINVLAAQREYMLAALYIEQEMQHIYHKEMSQYQSQDALAYWQKKFNIADSLAFWSTMGHHKEMDSELKESLFGHGRTINIVSSSVIGLPRLGLYPKALFRAADKWFSVQSFVPFFCLYVRNPDAFQHFKDEADRNIGLSVFSEPGTMRYLCDGLITNGHLPPGSASQAIEDLRKKALFDLRWVQAGDFILLRAMVKGESLVNKHVLSETNVGELVVRICSGIEGIKLGSAAAKDLIVFAGATRGLVGDHEKSLLTNAVGHALTRFSSKGKPYPTSVLDACATILNESSVPLHRASAQLHLGFYRGDLSGVEIEPDIKLMATAMLKQVSPNKRVEMGAYKALGLSSPDNRRESRIKIEALSQDMGL